jgi:hypothetical protein
MRQGCRCAPPCFMCAASHYFGRVARQIPLGLGRGIVTRTKCAKAASIHSGVLRAAGRRGLPVAGLILAVILNAAWIGFLAYWIFRLV